jgi:20S proteasome alpha/beta subunit
MITLDRSRLPYPLKHSYPEAMTIGIAAHARESFLGKPGSRGMIVFCCDWLAGDDYSGSETVDKFDETFAPGLACVVAGTITDARDLKSLCRKHIGLTRLDGYDLELALEQARQEFMERLTKKKQGGSSAEILLGGFLESGPTIFLVNAGQVHEIVTPAVGVIGIGSIFADPLLRWRQAHEPVDLLSNAYDTVYRIYEAKRFSETCRDVGKATTVALMRPGEKLEDYFRVDFLPHAWLEFLGAQYERIGPQKLPKKREYFGDLPGVIRDTSGHRGGNA